MIKALTKNWTDSQGQITEDAVITVQKLSLEKIISRNISDDGLSWVETHTYTCFGDYTVSSSDGLNIIDGGRFRYTYDITGEDPYTQSFNHLLTLQAFSGAISVIL